MFHFEPECDYPDEYSYSVSPSLTGSMDKFYTVPSDSDIVKIQTTNLANQEIYTFT